MVVPSPDVFLELVPVEEVEISNVSLVRLEFLLLLPQHAIAFASKVHVLQQTLREREKSLSILALDLLDSNSLSKLALSMLLLRHHDAGVEKTSNLHLLDFVGQGGHASVVVGRLRNWKQGLLYKIGHQRAQELLITLEVTFAGFAVFIAVKIRWVHEVLKGNFQRAEQVLEALGSNVFDAVQDVPLLHRKILQALSVLTANLMCSFSNQGLRGLEVANLVGHLKSFNAAQFGSGQSAPEAVYPGRSKEVVICILEIDLVLFQYLQHLVQLVRIGLRRD